MDVTGVCGLHALPPGFHPWASFILGLGATTLQSKEKEKLLQEELVSALTAETRRALSAGTPTHPALLTGAPGAFSPFAHLLTHTHLGGRSVGGTEYGFVEI